MSNFDKTGQPPAAMGLERFVTAQAGVFETAFSELRAGRKATHWMWFVLPQLRGLGASSLSRHFGIDSLDEARAYLAHGVLGPRLMASMEVLRNLEGRTAREIFGEVDALKFRSCLTLFATACAPDDGRRGLKAKSTVVPGSGSKRGDPSDTACVFRALLVKYFDGHADQRTKQLLDVHE